MTDILIWASSLGLVCLALYWVIRRRDPRPLLLWAVVILGGILWALSSSGVIQPPWSEEMTSRGEGTELLILALYGAMLVGMLSHYLYFHLSRPRKRRSKFDLGTFLAPVFASPIVFLPLASVFESLGSQPAMADASRLMLFLVAFENGFFWREFFENRKKAWEAGGEE